MYQKLSDVTVNYNMENSQEEQEQKVVDKPITLEEVLKLINSAYGKDGSFENKEIFYKTFSSFLKQEFLRTPEIKKYNIIVMFDNIMMIKSDSDKIYDAFTALEDKNKPLLLILVSNGGEPGSAYLIGKLCQEFSNGKFVVVVPRHAKSAATLLSCAANEIHMGSLSELGPIDLQISGMPALGLKNSIEHIAELSSKNPGASEMFASYLNKTVEPIQIGYYERAAESVMQYAEKLLQKNKSSLSEDPVDVAKKLVYDYKDHGFVIDKEEAELIFGPSMIKTGTKEYEFGNAIYDTLKKIEDRFDIFGQSFYFIGSSNSKPGVFKKKR